MLTKEHEWIEPGETVFDEILVRLDTGYPAYRVELWLNSTSKVTWVAKTIVGPTHRQITDVAVPPSSGAVTAPTLEAAGANGKVAV